MAKKSWKRSAPKKTKVASSQRKGRPGKQRKNR